ncbi:hypothetical protein F442_10800 [Phytophthora nicotianae P10297]|uniref:ZSWIM1/3 RNaseH-like domain-containing protein n=1 Tax=Phytophthora nicotianae P10297 TaxID=1317064 RepID=W2Z5F2_PHYNI|nr:hypothetical protein F442_10800 [Phytophthora nicotianae P10297]
MRTTKKVLVVSETGGVKQRNQDLLATAYMCAMFGNFPEVLLMDCTHKIKR